ncbi:ubiquitin carboxyl-terminal hydrolase 1 [Bubalus kerabau]|uniref:ubiquitin carboxyl-terminal hydrolase 1 n=1 Tax=Bubalus carabanensis TaxID=3119969 RepID=UPI00244EC33E|nr:ubiquitin carboxyl-terminal hydrolase 1 [Bubalus carabanensis]XP_055441624.1 ubiquitin carboxyl-terminal hydrolase 1 [Bubalus carabanensis]XP_055441625.1 ubiquitin carboxyl-terminal hydrolase 1 [Bubalus carabanensis]XP_055441626.1 ubiquitin carboxyl-terminal hydrolase 1 [Bubalus carabanensis]
MPGVIPSESNGLSRGSPSKKNRLSLKFFQKKETKRALDFTDSQENEEKTSEYKGSEIDQVVPAAQSSPINCEKRENLLPFVGLNNLGNTCYLNSILQVLYFCPGFKSGVKHLFNIISRKKEALKDEANQKDKGNCKEDSLASYELICSLQSLIISVEQLQASFLLNPEKYTDELATQPRRLLNTLRELNPMYEGYLQHDAQEVLQCILGNIQETCQLLKKEEVKNVEDLSTKVEEYQKEEMSDNNSMEMDNMRHSEDYKEKLPKGNGKRKSDAEFGNMKKKVKISKEHQSSEENQRQTRSKRKAAGDTLEISPKIIPKHISENESTRPSQRKSKVKINWLKSAAKQPSILSKFCSMGKIATNQGSKGHCKENEYDLEEDLGKYDNDNTTNDCELESPGNNDMPINVNEVKPINKGAEQIGFELVEKLFQGQLVLRTRCLECESLTERREDFQDISVPVQEDELSKVEENSEISPEPKTEMKTLRWAISQFASVERIVGEDKYFCENCHHYTEAERSLLFDKMPEVITIHLKCFAASGLEFDCYGGGLSKINTPLLTPLKLSLEEWSTKPTNDSYGLFAVVMHSGITISSGHYTASVKVTDLNSLELDKENFVIDQTCEIGKPEPLNEEEVRGVVENYDNEEVSIRVSGNNQPSKVLNKKNVEAIGLLGGQKSKADYELYNKASNPDKVASTALPENRNSETNNTNGTHESDSNKESSDQTGINISGFENKISYVVQSLKEYEGKWLLFDDSEVKVTEEKDFLNSLSPSTSPTSTPYLLFYKKL